MKKKIYKIPNTKGLNAYCIETNKTIELYCNANGKEELIATYNKDEQTTFINGIRSDPYTVRYRSFKQYLYSRYETHIPDYIVYQHTAFRNQKYHEGKYKEPKHYRDDDGSVWYRMPLHSYNGRIWIREDDKYIDILDYGTKIARYKRNENVIVRYGLYSVTSCKHFIWFADMICHKTGLKSVTVWLHTDNPLDLFRREYA